jgi:hypothetical protein
MYFIVLRCASSPYTWSLWIQCCRCIRRQYPTSKIIIIDDHSLHNASPPPKDLADIPVVTYPEYRGRGEMLPAYFLATHSMARDIHKAVILHDSMFVQSSSVPVLKKAFENTHDVMFLWSFGRKFPYTLREPDHAPMQDMLVRCLKKADELDNVKYIGCFGGACILSKDFAVYLGEDFDLWKLLDLVTTRPGRCCYERVFAMCCVLGRREGLENIDVFGDIFDYPLDPFKYTYSRYLHDTLVGGQQTIIMPPVVKIWVGR